MTTAGAQAVAGNAGNFEAGSLVQPADGSQAPRALITKQDGITVVDRLGNNATVEFPEATIGGGFSPRKSSTTRPTRSSKPG